MNLHEIGKLVRERRDTLGLSQDRLAKLAGLSRATINQLETGALVDLGEIKLACLLELVGLTFEAHARTTPHRVGAGANVLSFGRFQNAEGIAAALA